MKPCDKEHKILYEDNHILAVVKPHGILTQSTDIESDSLTEQLKAFIKARDVKPGNLFLHTVHRLDKPTSGIVLFAKTSKALSRLNEAMRNNAFEKRYFATVEGILCTKKGVLEHYLKHASHKAMLVSQYAEGAKMCKLTYEVLRYEEHAACVMVVLHTGRYHQIRAQFAAIGHPVVGDTLYGAKTRLPDGAISLHHGYLRFLHPVTKQEIILEC